MGNELEFVVNPYASKDSVGRKGVMLRGPWQPGHGSILKSAGVTAIFLNSAKGWADFDCGFLEHLPELEEVNIIAPKVSGLEALGRMPRLTELAVTASTTSVVDFKGAKSLTKCYLYWWPGAASIFESESLVDIHLDSIRTLPENWAEHWSGLRRFALGNSSTPSLDNVEKLLRLERLELDNLPKISDFSMISALKELRWLSITGCKRLGRIDFAEELSNLEVLLLVDNGAIASLKPISALAKLKAVSFVGSTNIVDGDLHPVAELPELSMLGFGPKKHYSHRLAKPWSWKNFGKPDQLLIPK